MTYAFPSRRSSGLGHVEPVVIRELSTVAHPRRVAAKAVQLRRRRRVCGSGAAVRYAWTGVHAAARREGHHGLQLSYSIRLDRPVDRDAARHRKCTQDIARGGIGLFQERQCRSRSDEHTSELQSLMRISYAVFCMKKTIIY